MTLANGRLNGTNTTHDIGGSIMVRDESVTVNRVDFVNNRAAQNGGVFNFIQAGVVGAFNDCTFTGNIAGDGGAIRVAANGTITVTNGVFTGNTATNAGGAISNVGGMVVVNGGSITANTANNVGVLGGGGVYNNNTAATTTLTNVAISGNTARLAGGGVFLGTGTLSLDSVTLTANTAASTGGGVYVTSGLFTMNNSTLTNNSSALGGGLVVTGNNGSPLVISKTTFQGNASGDAGGAIYVSANAAILQISDSLFAANTAVGNGGAIRQNDASTIEITNSTGSGNKANLGGGFHSVTAGTLKIFNSTIAYNTAGATGGGGIRMVSGVTELTNTIVSNNTSTNGADISTVSPFFVTTDRVLVSDSIGFTENPLTPTIFADAQLNPLANNGGPTQTHSLKVGSPAIDAGTNSLALSFDQRGQGRTYDDPLVTNAAGGDGTDIGAYEGQLASAAKVTSIVINNGAAQRSRVTTLKVNFDTPVTIANPNNAFTLNRVTPSAGSVTLNTVLDGSGLFATITFTGGLVDGAPGNYSIQDGRYTLTIVPAEFGGAGVDGNSGVLTSNNYNSTPYVDGSTPATGIFRLFGDGSGNGKVESDDFLAFRLAFLSSNDAFDFDGNGQVASPDFLSFRLNFLDQIV
jgi:predicted outer membrane repeat protein